jgi:hypothetical protein
MVTWNSLPIEIRNLVLYNFCLNVVEEYNNVQIDVNDISELKWPKPPKCLSSLASALHTCRYFHNVITRIIKVDGESVVETLQELQFYKLMEIQNALCGCQEAPVGLFFNTVGYFWRNPKLAKNGYFIGTLTLWNDPKSSLMLIPHLEDWVTYNTSRASGHRRQIHLTLSEMEGSADLVLLTDSEGQSTVAGCDSLEICPIIKLYGVRDRNTSKAAPPHHFERLPIVQDIINSSAHSWWLFRRTEYQWDGSLVNKWWCLVNYKTKQMHMRPQHTSRVAFEDVWNPSEWRRYRLKHHINHWAPRPAWK